MKKSVVLNTYLTAVMALTMTFAVACTGPGQSPTLGAQAPTGSPNLQQPADGTTDGAGGNGVNGKIYESYIVDPVELPAFKNVLKSKFEILNKLSQEDNKKKEAEGDVIIEIPYENFLKIKTWYIADVSLKSLNKKTIGVEFTNENTEQLALQTENEVWIDSKAFNKMNEQDQANLLMHEYLMSMYTFQREPTEVSCKKLVALNNKVPADFCSFALTPYSKPQSQLTKKDYENIRAATAFIMSVDKNTTHDEFVRTMTKNDFWGNKRETLDPTKGNNVSLNASETLELLKSAYYSKVFNGSCFGLKTDSSRSKCTFELAISEDQNSAQILVKDASNGEVLRKANISIPYSSWIETYKTKDGGSVYEIKISPGAGNAKEGDAIDAISIFFTGSDQPQTMKKVVGIILMKQVLSSITKGSEVKDGKTQNCSKYTIDDVVAEKIQDDSLLLSSVPDFKLTLNSYQMTNGQQKFSFCSAQP